MSPSDYHNVLLSVLLMGAVNAAIVRLLMGAISPQLENH